MSQFLLGQRVIVVHGDPSGPGTVHDVYGGPVDFSYRVLMDQRGEDGNRTMAMTNDFAMVAGDPITPYELSQHVQFFGRSAIITDIVPATDDEDPRDALLEVTCEEDPAECFSGVRHNYVFVVPAWKLYAYAR